MESILLYQRKIKIGLSMGSQIKNTKKDSFSLFKVKYLFCGVLPAQSMTNFINMLQ